MWLVVQFSEIPPVTEAPSIDLTDWRIFKTDQGTRHFAATSPWQP